MLRSASLVALMSLTWLFWGVTVSRASPVEDAAGLLRHYVEEEAAVTVGETRIEVSRLIQRFYRERNYLPAWINSGVRRQADTFVRELRDAGAEGLSPEHYPVGTIEALIESVGRELDSGASVDLDKLAGLDLLLTDTFFSYSYHLIAGRINPSAIEGEWAEYGWQTDLDRALRSALGKDRIAETLRLLAPPHEGYLALRDALASYRDIASGGGWPAVPPGASLELGSMGERVRALKDRLFMSGDLGAEDYKGELFDLAVELAVRKFQERHGLEVDGKVGPRTLGALNVPVQARIRKMELNMERWRWLPEDLGERHILINAANFELVLKEYGSEVMRMRIVVGKPYWHTPSFSATMTYLVLNPVWNVPNSIAVNEILPKLRKDPGFLAEEGFRVLKGWGRSSVEVDPASIDWRAIPEQDFPYRFQQLPGKLNPLGRVKFMFPNRFNVYLHDTPSKELFDMTVRTFSHGCIRIEQPIELAYHLLRDAGWTYAELLDAIDSGEQREVRLPMPIKVHPLYWTAWVDYEGTVHFRNDIYGRDELLEKALRDGPTIRYR